MTTRETWQAIQRHLGLTPDGDAGALTARAVLDALGLKEDVPSIHKVKASSFADDADVRGYIKAKKQGMSDTEAFKHGDNGLGVWFDNTNTGALSSGFGIFSMCALPPDDMIIKWGEINNARHKRVRVSANGKTITCVLADRMPWKKNIKNGAGIDLNPIAAKELGLKPPFMVDATWQWAEE